MTRAICFSSLLLVGNLLAATLASAQELNQTTPKSGEPALMSVSVSAEGETLKLGAPVRVLSLVASAASGGEQYGRSFNWGAEYDVFPDGSFAISRGFTGARSREIVLVQHWFEEVKRLAPPR